MKLPYLTKNNKIIDLDKVRLIDYDKITFYDKDDSMVIVFKVFAYNYSDPEFANIAQFKTENEAIEYIKEVYAFIHEETHRW